MKSADLLQLAKTAQRDGLTLQWSMKYLMERLERIPQQIAERQRRDTREGDATAHTLRVEREALALVLAAVLKAYPAGADVTLD